MINRYLVDTSIWVEFFRGKSQVIRNRIIDLLTEDRIVICAVVVAELLLGARGKKEIEFVKQKLTQMNRAGLLIALSKNLLTFIIRDFWSSSGSGRPQENCRGVESQPEFLAYPTYE